MASVSQSEVISLRNQIAQLKEENAQLRKELDKKQAYIQQLEDVSLTLSERSILLGKSFQHISYWKLFSVCLKTAKNLDADDAKHNPNHIDNDIIQAACTMGQPSLIPLIQTS